MFQRDEQSTPRVVFRCTCERVYHRVAKLLKAVTSYCTPAHTYKHDSRKHARRHARARCRHIWFHVISQTFDRCSIPANNYPRLKYAKHWNCPRSPRRNSTGRVTPGLCMVPVLLRHVSLDGCMQTYQQPACGPDPACSTEDD